MASKPIPDTTNFSGRVIAPLSRLALAGKPFLPAKPKYCRALNKTEEADRRSMQRMD